MSQQLKSIILYEDTNLNKLYDYELRDVSRLDFVAGNTYLINIQGVKNKDFTPNISGLAPAAVRSSLSEYNSAILQFKPNCDYITGGAPLVNITGLQNSSWAQQDPSCKTISGIFPSSVNKEGNIQISLFHTSGNIYSLGKGIFDASIIKELI